MAGQTDALEEMAREAYDPAIGLDLPNVAVKCCVTKAPNSGEMAGRSPVDRGKQGMKRSIIVDGESTTLGVVDAGTHRHDSPLLALGGLPEPVNVHLNRAYDSKVTSWLLEGRGLEGVICEKGKRAPLEATKRWGVGRTDSWTNAHKQLRWCTEREGRVIASPTRSSS